MTVEEARLATAKHRPTSSPPTARPAISRCSVAASAGRTRRTRVHEDGSLRVRFPNAAGDALEAVIVNTGGGMTGGDRFAVEIALGRGRAADRRHRGGGKDLSLAPGRTRRWTSGSTVGDGARLAWLPQETILFDRARLSRRIDVDLAEDASLLMAEAVVFGRSAMGEAMHEGFFADRWRVRREGRLVYADTRAARRRHRAKSSASRPSAAGGIAIATVLIAPGDDGNACRRARARANISPARSASRPGTASRWRGFAPRTAPRCATI